MQCVGRLLEMTRDGEPWALARFNDGEMSAIVKREGSISRGAQVVTPELAGALEEALKYRRHNYWIGLPCGTCWKSHRKEAVKRCNPKYYPHTTLAVVLTNRNHKLWQEEFPDAVKDRQILWVGPHEQNTMALPFADRIYERVIVPEKNAWEAWQELDDGWNTGLPYPSGTVAMTSCGPLGRVIAHRWFSTNPEITVIDVGSIYDPILTGRKTARIHKGTLPRCRECH